MRTLAFLAVALLANPFGEAFGDIPGHRLSDSDKVLNAPEIHAKKPVLIYYANDRNLVAGTDPVQKRYSELIGMWKRMANEKSGTPEFRKQAGRVAAALEQDAERFPRSVDQEMVLLRELFCSDKAPLNVGLVLVRNWGSVSLVDTRYASVKKTLLRYEYCLPVSGTNTPVLQTRYLAREWDADKVLDIQDALLAQPLSFKMVFDWFLADVAKVFSPEEYRFAFYGKTHGTNAYFFEGPLTATFMEKAPEVVLPAVMEVLSEVKALSDGSATPRTIAAIVYNAFQKLDPVPPELPDSNQFLEKGAFLQSLSDLVAGNALKTMHFSHVVIDSNFAPVELSPVQNARDFMRNPPKYSNAGIEAVDYLHLRNSVSEYHPFALDKLFLPGRPVTQDFMEHFRKHIEAAVP